MTSKIQNELQAATKVTMKRGESFQDYAKRLVLAVQDLSDKEWDALSEPAQDWFNDAGDAINAKQDVKDFPDAEPDEAQAEETTTRRRRRAAAEEETPAAYAPKAGDKVTATTKRGKVYSGEVVELDGNVVVIDDGKEELELDGKTTTFVLEGGEQGAAEEDGPRDPQVGDTVTVTTKRGKVHTGNVIEMDDDVLVIKDAAGEEQEFNRDRVESIVVKVSNAKDTKDAEEPKSSRRRASTSDAKQEPAAGDDGKKTRARNGGGVSVGTRIKELILDNLDAPQEAIEKLLKKEGLQFSDATLNMIYGDTHKFLKLMADRKLFKK